MTEERTSEKFIRFKSALEALCIAYEVTLSSEMYDLMEVWDRRGDECVFHSGIVDQTRKASNA